MKYWIALCATLFPVLGLAEPIDVWIDADPSAGLFEQEVDDALALIQAFNSPELAIHGISITFGNAEFEKAMPIGRKLTEMFGPKDLGVYGGAASKEDLGKRTPAVEAMANALKKTRLHILALGPVTNIGSLLQLHPELHENILSIIVVAGRRPGQRFTPKPDIVRAATDFNFEHDAESMQVILDSAVPFVMAPWEVSSQVWVSEEDMATLKDTGPSGAWLSENTASWIARWERYYGVRAFNPFDSLAIGWLTHPELLQTTQVAVRIETLDNDMLIQDPKAPKRKPYLLVYPGEEEGRQAIYCHTPDNEFKAKLLERLKGSK